MKKFLQKLPKWAKILIGVFLGIFAILWLIDLQFTPAKEFVWGLNFSQVRARELGFDPNEIYLGMLSDLKPKKIRLVAYWDLIEPEIDKYDFSQMDWMLSKATEYNSEVIFVVGRKEPRWPECHQPDWVKSLPQAEQDQVELDMIKVAVEHFKAFPIIKIWQVENEPQFGFGDNCPKISRDVLKKEVALVKSLDSRPTMTTDSGELGRWLPTATVGADLFGTTMYRVVHNSTSGYFKYPLPPVFFHIKAGILKVFTKLPPPIGVELQAEPWFANGIENTDLDTQKALMNPKIFQSNIEYAKQAGFSDNYLWGVEWWYWMAKNQDDWGMWTAAKNLLSGK